MASRFGFFYGNREKTWNGNRVKRYLTVQGFSEQKNMYSGLQNRNMSIAEYAGQGNV